METLVPPDTNNQGPDRHWYLGGGGTHKPNLMRVSRDRFMSCYGNIATTHFFTICYWCLLSPEDISALESKQAIVIETEGERERQTDRQRQTIQQTLRERQRDGERQRQRWRQTDNTTRQTDNTTRQTDNTTRQTDSLRQSVFQYN